MPALGSPCMASTRSRVMKLDWSRPVRPRVRQRGEVVGMAEFVTEGFARVARELGREAVGDAVEDEHGLGDGSGIVVQTSTRGVMWLSLIHISEPTRLGMISYAVFCLK